MGAAQAAPQEAHYHATKDLVQSYVRCFHINRLMHCCIKLLVQLVGLNLSAYK